MAVDLGDLIDPVKREISPPGSNLFPTATDDELLGYLTDAFWEARLDGFKVLDAFSESDSILSPVVVGGTDITRDLQQLIVFYAGLRILRLYLMNLSQNFRAKAGPVEFETSGSSSFLVHLLDDLRERRNVLMTRLSDLGVVNTFYIDAIVARDQSLAYGDTYWPSNAAGMPPYGSYANFPWV